MSDDLWCCYIDDDSGKECGEDAEWVIWDGIEPFYDHYTHACTKHVGELLSDSEKHHRVYPVEWDQPVLEVA